MSRHRRNPRRDANEPDIAAALRAAGATVHLINETGVPDLLIGSRGKLYLIEVKSPTGQMTTAQEEFFAKWSGPQMVVQSRAEALAILHNDLILDPDGIDRPLYVGNNNLRHWRPALKWLLYERRGGVSDKSGHPLNGHCEMHEGIITRARVPRSVWWHYKIHHEYNCFLLLPKEHRPYPPSPDWCIARSFDLYGRETIEEWFYGLPWKGRPSFTLDKK